MSLNERWEQQAYEIVEVAEVGDDTVVARYQGPVRGRASGIADEFDYWCASTFRRGKVLNHEWFASRATALDAAGRQK